MSIIRFASPRRLAALTVAPLLIAPLAVASPAAAVSPDLVISQVYGGGGNSGAPYTNDFIEIFNRGASAVSLSGMSLQYASATGTGNFGASATQLTELPNVTVDPGEYFLVQEAGGATGQPLPTPVFEDPSPISMSATAGKVVLATGTTSIGCNGGSTPCDATAVSRIVDLVGYGSTNFYEGAGPAPAQSNSTAALRANSGTTDTDNNASDFASGAPNPRNTANPEPPPPPNASCDVSPTNKVWEIQGSGATSPLVGQTASVRAVVTAVMPGLSGFFVQEEAADSDGSEATSDGVFVRTSLPSGAGVSDVVKVAGGVREFASSGSSQTQISSGVTVSRCAAGELPPAAVLEFPVDDVRDFEHYEGMRVTMPQSLVISEYFNFDRFNEVVVGLPMPDRDRFDTPTAVVEPGTEAVALAAEYAKRRITIDDGRGSQNASPPIFPGTVATPFTLANRFRGGDTLTNTTGVVEHTFGLYRVHPTENATYTRENPRPEAPPSVGGDVKVASFNVLNYFLTLDALDDGTGDADDPADNVCGGNQDLDCRGADASQPKELSRQRAKILDAIAQLDADVVGLMEMENTPGVEPAADLAAGLNDLVGAGTYSYIDTGVIGTDAIRLGLLYRTTTVEPVGVFHVLDSSVDPRFLDDKNRPALAQTFKPLDGDHKFTVAVNHLKSKGSDCNDVDDPDTGDGQGNCNGTRTAAAQALADWLDEPWIGAGDPDRLIIGDLNSYDHEDPIDALVAAGYTDMIKASGGEYAYGYVFDGQVGYLDHALANASMAGQITGAAEWHINADEPDILDYDTSFKNEPEELLYEPNAYRSSDHDAVLVGLELTGRSRNR